MKVKIRQADKLFSKYIRRRAGWRCEVCQRLCRLDGEILWKLEASHYHSRKKESTRFDPENVVSLCFQCHMRMGGHGSQEYDGFMERKLGTRALALLNLRANTYKKRDDKLDLLYAKQLLKELEAHGDQ